MEQWNSREGVGNRDAIRLLWILSSGLLSILIASLFPSRAQSRRSARVFQYEPSQMISAEKLTHSFQLATAQPLSNLSCRETLANGARRLYRSALARIVYPLSPLMEDGLL